LNGSQLDGGKISGRQATLLLVNLILPTGLFFLSSVASRLAGRDAWLSMLLATLAGMLIALMAANLSLRFPDKTLFQFPELILGRWPGKFIVFLYVWYFVHTTAEVLRQFGDFMVTAFLPETPIIVVEILIMAIVAYAVRKGLEVFARVNDLVFPLIFVSVVIILSLAAREMDFKRLLPIFADSGIAPLIKGAVMPAAWMGYAVTICVLTPHLNKKHEVYKAAVLSTVIFGLFLSVVAVASIASFGPEISAQWMVPFLSLTRMVDIAKFLSRLEPVIMAVWVAGGAVQISFFHWLGALGCAQWLGLKDYKPIVLPLMVIVLALNIALHDSIMHLFSFLGTFWGPYSLTLFQAGIPFFLLVIAILRGQGVKKS
jgi:spore germination protein KB